MPYLCLFTLNYTGNHLIINEFLAGLVPFTAIHNTYLGHSKIWSWKSAKRMSHVAWEQFKPKLVIHLLSLVLLFWKYWKILEMAHLLFCGASGWKQMSWRVMLEPSKGTFMLVMWFWRSKAYEEKIKWYAHVQINLNWIFAWLWHKVMFDGTI